MKDTQQYVYPEGFNGMKDPDEQAEILFSKYQFPLGPLASIAGTSVEKKDGLAVMPFVSSIAPSWCENHYQYAISFLLERFGHSRNFTNWCEDCDQAVMQQTEHSVLCWNRLEKSLGRGFTPAISVQLGMLRSGQSMDDSRKDVRNSEREMLLGAFHFGIILLTHPELIQGPGLAQGLKQLYFFCAGDECAPNGDGRFTHGPVYDWDEEKLRYIYHPANRRLEQYGSPSAFLPKNL